MNSNFIHGSKPSPSKEGEVAPNYSELVKQMISKRKDNPIDLLHLNLAHEEYNYLEELKYTYIRTLNDLTPFLKQGMRVLEIGALFGIVSIALKKSGFDVTATDIPEFHKSKELQNVYFENNIAFHSLNLVHGKLEYADESFNAVVLCEVIEHLNFNPIPVLKEINRVLKKGGVIYLATPNQANLYNRIRLLFGRSIYPVIDEFFYQMDKTKNHIVSMHWREYTMQETVEMLVKTGFAVEKKYYFTEIGTS